MVGVSTVEWRVVQQLGKKGKEGEAFEVQATATTKRSTRQGHAMKQFKPTKALSTFTRECDLQERAASYNVAPAVVDRITKKPLRVVMEMMSCTVIELIKQQGGELTDTQQEEIVWTCLQLDEAGVYHNDPNPLNLMVDFEGRFKWIDYGHSRIIAAKHGRYPNTRALRSLLHGGLMGLVTRGVLTGKSTVLDRAIEAAYGGSTPTTCWKYADPDTSPPVAKAVKHGRALSRKDVNDPCLPNPAKPANDNHDDFVNKAYASCPADKESRSTVGVWGQRAVAGGIALGVTIGLHRAVPLLVENTVHLW